MCCQIVLLPDGTLTMPTIYLGLLWDPCYLITPGTVKINTNYNCQQLHKNKSLMLAIEVMIVSDIPFLMAISRDIYFGTAKALQSQSKKSLLQLPIKSARGFIVHTLLGYGCLENIISNMGISLNISSNNKHVPEIERYNWAVKEWTRGTIKSLPFKQLITKIISEKKVSIHRWKRKSARQT